MERTWAPLGHRKVGSDFTPKLGWKKREGGGGGGKTGGKITTSEPPQLGASKKGTKLGMMTDRQRHRRAAGH